MEYNPPKIYFDNILFNEVNFQDAATSQDLALQRMTSVLSTFANTNLINSNLSIFVSSNSNIATSNITSNIT